MDSKLKCHGLSFPKAKLRLTMLLGNRALIALFLTNTQPFASQYIN